MRAGGSGKGGRGGEEGRKGGGKGGAGGGGGGGGVAPIHRYTVPSSLPRSAYRRICLLDRRIGVSAYLLLDRRIGVFFPRTHIGERRPTVVSAYRRMCPLRAMRRRIGVSVYRRKAVLRHYLQARCYVLVRVEG